MIYTNDLPSGILTLETEQRLRQLGCAVTAGKNAPASALRMPRSGKAKKAALSGGGIAFVPVYGKAQSDD